MLSIGRATPGNRGSAYRQETLVAGRQLVKWNCRSSQLLRRVSCASEARHYIDGNRTHHPLFSTMRRCESQAYARRAIASQPRR